MPTKAELEAKLAAIEGGRAESPRGIAPGLLRRLAQPLKELGFAALAAPAMATYLVVFHGSPLGDLMYSAGAKVLLVTGCYFIVSRVVLVPPAEGDDPQVQAAKWLVRGCAMLAIGIVVGMS